MGSSSLALFIQWSVEEARPSTPIGSDECCIKTDPGSNTRTHSAVTQNNNRSMRYETIIYKTFRCPTVLGFWKVQARANTQGFKVSDMEEHSGCRIREQCLG